MKEEKKPIIIHRRDAVVTIALNRPEVQNAMSVEMWNELHQGVKDLKDDHSVKVLILRGTGGRSFSSGMDIKKEYETFTSDIAKIGNIIHGCSREMMTIPQVVVCVVEGYCFGGALELMLACDFVLANDLAVFSMPEMKVGIPCMVEAALLVPTVGLLKAKEMCYLGRTYDAFEAKRMGLVNEVVKAGELEQRLSQFISELTSMDAKALSVQKEIIYKWLTTDLETAMQYSILAMKQCEGSEAQRTRMKAALRKK
jgi:enoyl-CoA hydratase/carnithine racemase